ncbi:hypothetical protein [Sphingobacterium multivorum]|uniref:hypothetical protein n=1 Tax=Sphingobacterium multivorum TaxID=28454 RepID=UPI0031B9C2C0
MKIISSLLLLLVFSSGCSQTKQEVIIEKYLKNGAYRYHYDAVNAEKIMREAKVNAEQGFTITEDDSFYESYPYKVNWHMAKWTIPNYVEN